MGSVRTKLLLTMVLMSFLWKVSVFCFCAVVVLLGTQFCRVEWTRFCSSADARSCFSAGWKEQLLVLAALRVVIFFFFLRVRVLSRLVVSFRFDPIPSHPIPSPHICLSAIPCSSLCVPQDLSS